MTRIVSPVPKYILDMVPVPTGKNETVKAGDEDVMKDTMPMLISKCKRTLHHTKKLAAFLKGSSLNDTLRNDWNLIYRHIRYEKDKAGFEQVRSPRRLIHEGKGDCDCFVVTLSSLLTNQHIPHYLRVIKQQDDAYTHIYLIVPKTSNVDLDTRSTYVVLDAVTNRYDHEPDFTDKKDFNMALQYLDGLKGHGSLGDTHDRCKSIAINTIRYIDTQELRERGLVPTVEFLKENNIVAEYTENDKGQGSFLVSTATGVKSVPTVMTKAESETLLNDVNKHPAYQAGDETLLASGTIPSLPPAVKTLGWIALATGLVAMLWPTANKPFVPAPKLSGVKKPARTYNSNKKVVRTHSNKIQTITI